MKEIECAFKGCKKIFKPKYKNQKYCSHSCSMENRKGIKRSEEIRIKIKKNRKIYKDEIRTCLNEDCLKTFICLPHSDRKYCSQSCANKKQIKTKKRNLKISKTMSGRTLSEKHKRNVAKSKIGKHFSKISKAKKKFWEDPDSRKSQIKSILKAAFKKFNDTEKKLFKFLQELFPGQFQFVGDGKFVIAGKCPDFVHVSEPLIIELFGDYWHSEEQTGLRESDHEQERKQIFESEGYKTLIIWEHELENEDQLKEKLIKFNNLLTISISMES